jgi:hypothetical protein
MSSKFKKAWDDLFTAITFAEANEAETARAILGKKEAEKAETAQAISGKKKKHKTSWNWEDIFTAITFAEEGDFETARWFLRSKSRILFVLEEGYPLRQELFDYVKNLSKTLNLPIEVFLLAEKPIEGLSTYLELFQKEGLLLRITQVKEKELWGKAITEYIKYHSEVELVEFLVVKPSFKSTKLNEERLVKTLWQKMGIPFILIRERMAI